VLDRLKSAEKYEKKRYQLGDIIQMQARRVATFVRGEREVYEPFLAAW